jgi:hypothetical protein
LICAAKSQQRFGRQRVVRPLGNEQLQCGNAQRQAAAAVVQLDGLPDRVAVAFVVVPADALGEGDVRVAGLGAEIARLRLAAEALVELRGASGKTFNDFTLTASQNDEEAYLASGDDFCDRARALSAAAAVAYTPILVNDWVAKTDNEFPPSPG